MANNNVISATEYEITGKLVCLNLSQLTVYLLYKRKSIACTFVIFDLLTVVHPM